MEQHPIQSSPHCLVVSYPAQGHINPLLQFSKRLQHKGVHVTLVTTRSFSNKLKHHKHFSSLQTISDGFDEGGIDQAPSTKAYLESLIQVGSQTLAQLLEQMQQSGSEKPIDCIVYDSFMPWCLDVAHKFGLGGAVFFTQPCSVASIYYHVQQGLIRIPHRESEICLPGLPPLQPRDLPSFVYDPLAYPAAIDLLLDQFTNINEADWLLCNTFYELEPEAADWLAKLWPQLKTIGPTVPSMYLDKKLKHDTDYGFNIFQPRNDACIDWLNTKPKGSVVYVSFGSLAALGPDQMEELSLGLKQSEAHFLWVVRESEEHKLAKDFIQETKGKGLVVSWAPQLEVLAHEAVGWFWTHCGWNSILEALSLGVPMVGMPRWSDQPTNAKCMMDVWKMGIRAMEDGNGVVKAEEVVRCVKEIMEGEKGKEMKANAEKWKELARASVDEGGTSDKNIDEFILGLRRRLCISGS